MKANVLESNSVKKAEIIKVKDNLGFSYTDDIAVEEPLEIRVTYGPKEQKTEQKYICYYADTGI